mmetsp:Transcript_2512/g.4920  ORF Transcript_2512/g.4920 Transcript_2512/m.4920 type:complete len:400 (-) Transcript_2512:96-1295(-)|eukprot:CAMPEP_0167794150 /NCGR_PEP_ID=MMETSP0111_2-20121227/13641_1 /TAXON_ID=91324 /ORGANISM="Lotharella globosa, Strain CCCM811" /LENGTH=399 /DNA_ID=CAMNT_0007687517 /DNA_START=10 /DNA_END=1209 /DNA_ORIENTATION=-
MADEKVKMEVDNQDEQEAEEPQDKLLVLAENQYKLQSANFSTQEKNEAKDATMKIIKESDMAPYYERICDLMGWTKDEKLLSEMKVKNEAEAKKLDDAIADAKKNRGETEVREAEVDKAKLYAKIGDKKTALEKYKEILETTVGTGQKIDIVFLIIRLGMAFNDLKLVKEYVTMAKDLVEKGGDWERRNLLKVYEATFLVCIRDFKAAADLFIESVATFTATAVYSYETMVVYTVITSMISLDRISLRKKVVKSPEILQIVQEMPKVQTLIQSLNKCNYAELFAVLVDISTMMNKDRYFAPHAAWWLREMRIVAYSQFLRSYRSVTLGSMARTFGVGNKFLDKELSRFIAAGRLNCKIDQVNLVIETNRPDAKNSQYADIIAKGDALLSRIQKLSIELT